MKLYIKDFFKGFLGEFIGMKIVANLPCWILRKLFFKIVFGVKIGKNSFLQMGCYIYPSKGKFYIGNNTVINRDSIIDTRGNVWIGDNVNISREAAIYTGGHVINSDNFEYYSRPVIIKDYVWIGTRAMIMPGVVIEKGAIVMPGAIVTKNVRENIVVGGIPAREIGIRKSNLNYELNYNPSFT